MNVERYRVPEVLFQPQMIGLDQSGITEIIATILKHQSPERTTATVSNVFLTGSHTFAGMEARLERDLQMLMPQGAPVKIWRAADVQLDAWRGAAKWASVTVDSNCFITRHQYDEMGSGYLAEHQFGNAL